MSEWPSGLRRQTQDIISFSVVEVSVLSMEAWDQIPLLTQALFELEAFLRPSTLYTLLFILPSDQCKSLTSLHWNVRMAEWSKTPDSRRHLLLSCWGLWSPHGGVGSNPTSDRSSFWIGSVFETVNIIVSIVYFAIWPMPMIELSLISLCQQVRMAERSKAPDSRHYQFLNCWGFWSPHGGVGSNPTSDTSFFWIESNVEKVNVLVFNPSFAFWPITFIELFQIPLLKKALL